MNTRLLLASATMILLALGATGQTYYYVDAISVAPSAPTTSDPVIITLHGNLSATNSYVIATNWQAIGSTVTLTVDAGSSGIGIPVLVPHDESFNIGTLSAGVYTIVITGIATDDLAPALQHTFTVTGGTATACDSVIIDFLQWAPFSDTAIVVHVFNYSTTLFDYPGWILFDSGGDTLAKETNGTFSGTLELWSDFYTSFECTFNWTGDLCPPDPCVMVYPQMISTGGAMVLADLDWSVLDGNGTVVGSGVFNFTNVQQYVIDSICLPPGEYTLSVNHPSTVGGALQFWLATANFWSATPAQEFTQDGVPDLMPFTFFEQCIDGTNAIGSLIGPAELTLAISDGTLHVVNDTGTPLGQVSIHDMRGRTVLSRMMNGAAAMFDVRALAPGIYLVHALGARAIGRIAIQ